MKSSRYLFLIPARGGSKGLPNKNILLLNGIPLLIHTLKAAREISDDDNICISTDSQDIINKVSEFNYTPPFKRPNHLATDTSTSEEVILHCIEYYKSLGREYEFIILLQPTSPLRTGKHIEEALKVITDTTEMIMSVKETDSNPYYVLFEEDKNGILQKSKSSVITRRQDLPKVYEANGAIYIINTQKLIYKGISGLTKTKFVMDKRSSVDIDDDIDFKLCELILKNSDEI